jgi:hypothetical protein
VNYTVAANTGSARAWTIMVDGQTYTVSQDGVGGSGAVCNFGNGFSNAVGITLVPSAAYATTSDGTVLRVTPATGSQSGAAYCTSPVQLGNNGTFSTQFQFRFSNPRFRIVYLFRAAEQHQRQPERDCQRWRRVLDHYTGRGWDFGRE